MCVRVYVSENTRERASERTSERERERERKRGDNLEHQEATTWNTKLINGKTLGCKLFEVPRPDKTAPRQQGVFRPHIICMYAKKVYPVPKAPCGFAPNTRVHVGAKSEFGRCP